MGESHLHRLCERLGYTFRDGALARLALTHSSYANEHAAEAPEHNERLEFLGDAVLDFVISDLLIAQHPDLPEGDLSKMRAALVTERALADIARELELGRNLRVGRGEAQSGGQDKDSILSDALEALLAAVYLDSRAEAGTAAIEQVVRRLFEGRLSTAGPPQQLEDFKTELQEWMQRRHKDTVRYEITGHSGPDHDRSFEAAVLFGGRELGRGRGRSKKLAEQNAARAALEALRAEQGRDAPEGVRP